MRILCLLVNLSLELDSHTLLSGLTSKFSKEFDGYFLSQGICKRSWMAKGNSLNLEKSSKKNISRFCTLRVNIVGNILKYTL